MTRLLSTLFAIALLTLSPHGSAATLPDELAHLEEMRGDEAALVEAVRRFADQQHAMIAWDRELMDDYVEKQDETLAETKFGDMQRRLQLIETAWQFVLANYENNARAHNYYGEFLYDYKQDPLSGVRHWNLAVTADPKLASPHNNLAIHYFHTGMYDQGLRHLGTALDLEPKNPDFLYNAAQLYLTYFPQFEQKYDLTRAELFKEAMRMSREAAKLAPDDYAIAKDYATNFYLGEQFKLDVDWDEAARAWQTAYSLAPNEDEQFFALLNEGRVWMRAGNKPKASEVLQKAAALNPESDVVKNLLAEAGGTGAPAQS